MSRMNAYIAIAAIVAAAAPITGVRAQQPPDAADALVQRAATLQGDMAAYGVAAGLYERSAALRSEGDARGVDALMMAGRLFHYAGEHARALAAMEQAGARALEEGDVYTAANAYADAAYIAAGQYDERAVELAQRVLRIADHWVPEDRAAILSRLGPQVVSRLRAQANG